MVVLSRLAPCPDVRHLTCSPASEVTDDTFWMLWRPAVGVIILWFCELPLFGECVALMFTTVVSRFGLSGVGRGLGTRTGAIVALIDGTACCGP